MNVRSRAGFVAVIAAAASLVLASAAGAAEVPFRANLTGNVSESVCGVLTICLMGSDRGTATHLGFARMNTLATIHLTFTACDGGGVLTTYTQTATVTAANGDTLTLAGGGIACVANGHALATGVLTVTGGSGRFVGATGRLAERIDHDLASHAETVDLSGTVSPVGSS